MTVRLVRSTREMEGRVEEVWALVDEADDLETWPADAELTVVGGEAIRQQRDTEKERGLLERAKEALARVARFLIEVFGGS